MDYRAAFMSPLEHPKWGLNILLLAVCFLIPVVGPIVAIGYLARCKRAWHHGEQYPEFDFQFFVEYLKNGLWPCLVTLLLYIVLLPFVIGYIAVSVIGISYLSDAGGGGNESGALIAAGVVICIVGFVVLSLLSLVVMLPPYLKSAIEQDFVAGFSWTFFKDFIKRVGGALMIANLVIFATYFPFILVGYLALVIGSYFTMAWWLFAAGHISYQLYELYLSRGGMELNFSQKLETKPESVPKTPPAPPPAIADGVPPLPPQ